jgi:hypothetical protein
MNQTRYAIWIAYVYTGWLAFAYARDWWTSRRRSQIAAKQTRDLDRLQLSAAIETKQSDEENLKQLPPSAKPDLKLSSRLSTSKRASRGC